jgi:hypothetical protein
MVLGQVHDEPEIGEDEMLPRTVERELVPPGLGEEPGRPGVPTGPTESHELVQEAIDLGQGPFPSRVGSGGAEEQIVRADALRQTTHELSENLARSMDLVGQLHLAGGVEERDAPGLVQVERQRVLCERLSGRTASYPCRPGARGSPVPFVLVHFLVASCSFERMLRVGNFMLDCKARSSIVSREGIVL